MQPVADHYSLDGVLTLVDAAHVMRHLDEAKPEGVVNEAVAQVAYADRIILNKTDLVRASVGAAAAGGLAEHAHTQEEGLASYLRHVWVAGMQTALLHGCCTRFGTHRTKNVGSVLS